MRVLALAGDGIGREIMPEALRIFAIVQGRCGVRAELVEGAIGTGPLMDEGNPFPAATETEARNADAVLFGAAGDPSLDHLGPKRPDSAIGALRKLLNLYGLVREYRIADAQLAMSPLRPVRARSTDFAIVREISGDVYAAQPKGQRIAEDGPFPGEVEGFDTMRYTESEVRRIAHLGFRTARARSGRLVSADKSNVLATSRLWQRVVAEVAAEYPDVALTHQLADNTAMQLVTDPASYDTILTANLFGDILSDVASALTGSIGLVASVVFNETGQVYYEPGHGSALDIAGQDKANPIAMIRCVALMLRHSFDRPDLASTVEQAIDEVLAAGLRTAEIHVDGTTLVSCSAMGKAIADRLEALLPPD
ncbi:3-isopropylmalate dehydrogenase [Croceicoccus marinus]|uniref:3-isopropylmalate dehydrogenase n=1 Tax=Croceicoccus marinus TaxID=450378 RepID=A0A1Z1F879_9SPHN|nr:3-isopropylmalate dehydrogenase [Croceicoccus marinus]ARU15011.1 hypothetical protein A9D14_01005 [Croceicoccus marinus]